MNRLSIMKKITLPLILFVSTWSGWMWAQSEDKPLLGVKAFENTTNYYNYRFTSAIGNGLTDLFITELHKTGKYRIIERAAVEELVKEVDFGKSGYVEKGSAVRKGHIKGIEYLFMAKITEFGAKDKTVGAGGIGGRLLGKVGVKQEKADVRVDFRIVDATTGETILADFGQGEEESRGLAMDGGLLGSGGGAIDLSSGQFLESKIGKATIKALHQIISKMDSGFLTQYKSGAARIKTQEAAARAEGEKAMQSAPGKILAVVNGVAVVNLGAMHGLKEGDKLKVYQEIHTKDSKGQVVYSEEKQVGELMVKEVQNERAKTAVVSGSGIAEGYIVKRP